MRSVFISKGRSPHDEAWEFQLGPVPGLIVEFVVLCNTVRPKKIFLDGGVTCGEVGFELYGRRERRVRVQIFNAFAVFVRSEGGRRRRSRRLERQY